MSSGHVFPYGITLEDGARITTFPAAEVGFATKEGDYVTLFLLIDSGAVISALPKTDAEVLGIQAEDGISFPIAGIDGVPIQGWRHEISVFLKKFGTTLNGRQYSRESFAAFESSLRNVRNNEDVMVDFEEVITSTPSWGDEFLAPLFSRFGDRLVLKNTDNLSVLATLKLLRKIYGKDFFKE